jgi:hypothetical protein
MTPYERRVAALLVANNIRVRDGAFAAICRRTRDALGDSSLDVASIADSAVLACIQSVRAADDCGKLFGDDPPANTKRESPGTSGYAKLEAGNAALAKREPRGDSQAIKQAMALWCKENAAKLERMNAAMRLDAYNVRLQSLRDGNAN